MWKKGYLSEMYPKEDHLINGWNVKKQKESMIYVGGFFEAKKSGYGELYDKEICMKTFEGNFKDDYPHGLCKEYSLLARHYIHVQTIGYQQKDFWDGWRYDYHENGKFMRRAICKRDYNVNDHELVNHRIYVGGISEFGYKFKYGIVFKKNGEINFALSYKRND